MEEYNAWIFLQDKWPLLLVMLAVIITIITVRLIGARKRKQAEKEKND
jgi:hypothetical protein